MIASPSGVEHVLPQLFRSQPKGCNLIVAQGKKELHPRDSRELSGTTRGQLAQFEELDGSLNSCAAASASISRLIRISLGISIRKLLMAGHHLATPQAASVSAS